MKFLRQSINFANKDFEDLKKIFKKINFLKNYLGTICLTIDALKRIIIKCWGCDFANGNSSSFFGVNLYLNK